MTKIYLLVLGLISFNTFTQSNNSKGVKTVTETPIDNGFEEYVNKNAISIIEVSNKSIGNLESVVLTSFENLTLKDLNIKALEEKAQYFSIKGSDKVLKVESLYRLRLAYQSKK